MNRIAATLDLKSKAGKIDLEASKINEMKNEAAERFDSAMSAATTGMIVGIVSGAASIASAVSGFAVIKESVKSLLGDMHFPSDALQRKIYDSEKETNTKDTNANDTSDATSSARDRKKASADNIQKFLDTLRSMNPQL